MSVAANENLRRALTEGQRIEARHLANHLTQAIYDLRGAIQTSNSWDDDTEATTHLAAEADRMSDLAAETTKFLRSLLA